MADKQSITIVTRRMGRMDAFYRIVHERLKDGETITIGGCDAVRANGHARYLKEKFNVDVDFEPCYSRSPMKLIYDAYDFSPEPAVLGIDYGTKKLFGYNFKLKS